MALKIWTYLCFGLLMALLNGCRSEQGVSWDQIKTLEHEKNEQAMRADKLQQENETLQQQVQTLSGLDSEVRLSQLDTLNKIKLGNRTGLYLKDNQQTLMIYLEPIDMQQDYIKAIGTVHIQFWNLDNPSAQAKLAEWTLTPAELQKLWGGNIFGSYYRLSFPLDNTITGQETELTVKATFTDSLSGKVLRDQTTVTQK